MPDEKYVGLRSTSDAKSYNRKTYSHSTWRGTTETKWWHCYVAIQPPETFNPDKLEPEKVREVHKNLTGKKLKGRLTWSERMNRDNQ